jgi:sirohydrochlorin cobaltochelatase
MLHASAPDPSSLGIVLFAHGSRDPLWRVPIEAISAAVTAQAPGTPVACAYLELCEPGLPEACQSLISQGVTHIRVMPVFFGMGKHAREDLPLLMDDLRKTHANVDFSLLPAAGEYPELTQLLARLALGQRSESP